MKAEERTRAIRMRQEGHTYSEIMTEIPIAKSTLSDWLKSVGLSTPQRQRITEKRLAAAKRGARARHDARLRELTEHIERGRKHVDVLTQRELWLVGIALYWAEGSKQRDSDPSAGIIFGNSDVAMIKVFLHWLQLMGVPRSDIGFELYVHETRSDDVPAFKRWWAECLGVQVIRISRVYFKRGNIKTNRKNIGDLYHGLLRIRVKSSTVLNRRVNGWVHGIVASLGDGVIGNTSAFEAEDSRFEP